LIFLTLERFIDIRQIAELLAEVQQFNSNATLKYHTGQQNARK
jgi:phosphotransferase system HPr-like phosphotransfer protein